MRNGIWMVLVCLIVVGCDKKVSISYYQDPSQEVPQGKVNVLVLNHGLVSEYPRDRFETAFGDEKGLSEAISQTLRQHSGVELGRVEMVDDDERIADIKFALRGYFVKNTNGYGYVKEGQPLNLPEDTLPDGWTWVITDWEYQVSSHVNMSGAHEAPGGSVTKRHAYGYYEFKLYCLLINKNRHVTRYYQANAKSKYNLSAKKLPLDKLLNTAVKSVVELMKGETPERNSANWPRSFHRM